jgi:hypothetical protein
VSDFIEHEYRSGEQVMHRQMSAILMAALVLGISFGVVHERAMAYPPCGPYQQPLVNNGSLCRPQYIGGELLRLATGVPFAWIRSEPSSHARVLKTIYPVAYSNLQIVSYSPTPIFSWDGYQNWFMVHPYPMDTNVVGWIEQGSLATVSTTGYPPEDPTYQAAWSTPVGGHVKPGVPFLWLRAQPASDAAVVDTIPANGALTITGSPSFDGVQWWWMVDYVSRRSIKQGYVEQALIIAQ